MMWLPAPTDFQIDKRIVHVWRTYLDISSVKQEYYWSLLSSDEQARASRFIFAKDRVHFIAARGVLRILLGQYLGKEPAQLVFKYEEKSKPFLPNDLNLQFNISHAGGIALFGFVLDDSIGIDIEWINPKVDIEQVAQHFFAPNEITRLMALAPQQRLPAFFNCWTRKEAFIKAKGDGLSFPLNQFEVSLSPDTPAALLATHWDIKEREDWSLLNLSLAEGFRAALAIRGTVAQVFRFYFSKP